MNASGTIESYWENGLLILNVQGPFNEVGLTECIVKLEEALTHKAQGNWNRIEIWDEETLGSPETVEIAKRLYQWYESEGCKHIAVVIENIIQDLLIKDMSSSRAVTFRNIIEAKKWIASR